LLQAIDGYVIAEGEFVGTFRHKPRLMRNSAADVCMLKIISTLVAPSR
jgi:hypothetical protein